MRAEQLDSQHVEHDSSRVPIGATARPIQADVRADSQKANFLPHILGAPTRSQLRIGQRMSQKAEGRGKNPVVSISDSYNDNLRAITPDQRERNDRAPYHTARRAATSTWASAELEAWLPRCETSLHNYATVH